ncbi:MAG: KAP family NTPase [Muribaculaceae bacterium]|nr:KAP family NTPase [Muribaculaceae bacterium]
MEEFKRQSQVILTNRTNPPSILRGRKSLYPRYLRKRLTRGYNLRASEKMGPPSETFMNTHISNLLKKYMEDPDPRYVVALIGKWGYGKSFFVEMWVKEREEN